MARTNLMDVSRQWASRPADEQYRAAASAILGGDESTVDDDAVVSRGDDAGA